MNGRIAALAVLLTLAATACGEPTSEEERYLESVAVITAAYQAEVEALPAASTGGDPADAAAFFIGVGEASETARAAIVALEPVEDLAGPHLSFAASVAEFARLSGRIAIGGRSLETQADLLAMANDPVIGVANFNAAAERMVDTCRHLQQAGAEGGTEVDLGCSGLGRG